MITQNTQGDIITSNKAALAVEPLEVIIYGNWQFVGLNNLEKMYLGGRHEKQAGDCGDRRGEDESLQTRSDPDGVSNVFLWPFYDHRQHLYRKLRSK